MRDLAEKIEATVLENAKIFAAIGDKAFSAKNDPKQWSKLEILGHLIDSAQNNIQRFVRGQYEDAPRIVYDQNQWVTIQHYQDSEKNFLIQLWVLINQHLCGILKNMSDENAARICVTSANEKKPLSFFAEDYLRHMLHHLQQMERK